MKWSAKTEREQAEQQEAMRLEILWENAAVHAELVETKCNEIIAQLKGFTTVEALIALSCAAQEIATRGPKEMSVALSVNSSQREQMLEDTFRLTTEEAACEELSRSVSVGLDEMFNSIFGGVFARGGVLKKAVN